MAVTLEAVNLAITNLPEPFAQLVRGSLYAIVCDDDTVSAVLIAGIAHRARCDGKPLHRVTASASATVISEGITQIEAKGAVSGAVVVIDQAERLFQLSDPRRASHAAQILAHWAGARNNIVITIFGSQAAMPRPFLNLRSASEHLAGFAQLHSSAGVYTLEFRHWIGMQGTTRRRSFSLTMDSASALVVNESAAELACTGASVREVVIAMRGCFETAGVKGSNRKEVDSYAAAILAATTLERGTVVLVFESQHEFQSLCDAVSAIRAIGRRAIRIVVRERSVRLRVAQSIALLRLGVSEIASGQSAASTIHSLVASLQGSRFERRFERDVLKVLGETQSMMAGGALEPSEFRADVEATIAATEPYNLGHALLRLYARPGRQLDAIKQMEQRLRDTAIARNGLEVWVFLFGCDRGDVRPMLHRVFGDSLTDVFSDWSVLDDRSRMLTALESIQSRSSSMVTRDAFDLVA
jgi:cellulose biosynthesis protein BcsE